MIWRRRCWVFLMSLFSFKDFTFPFSSIFFCSRWNWRGEIVSILETGLNPKAGAWSKHPKPAKFTQKGLGVGVAWQNLSCQSLWLDFWAAPVISASKSCIDPLGKIGDFNAVSGKTCNAVRPENEAQQLFALLFYREYIKTPNLIYQHCEKHTKV